MVELLRDGEKAEDHDKRFKSDGIYAKILQCSEESVIIDIRNPKLCPPVVRRSGWRMEVR